MGTGLPILTLSQDPVIASAVQIFIKISASHNSLQLPPTNQFG